MISDDPFLDDEFAGSSRALSNDELVALLRARLEFLISNHRQSIARLERLHRHAPQVVQQLKGRCTASDVLG